MRILMTSVVFAITAHATTPDACPFPSEIPQPAVAEPSVVEPLDAELPWWPSIAGVLLLAVLARRHPLATAG